MGMCVCLCVCVDMPRATLFILGEESLLPTHQQQPRRPRFPFPSSIIVAVVIIGVPRKPFTVSILSCPAGEPRTSSKLLHCHPQTTRTSIRPARLAYLTTRRKRIDLSVPGVVVMTGSTSSILLPRTSSTP